MLKRPTLALAAALALLAAVCTASFAQTPTPTPTATAAQDDGTAADPPADASKEVKAVYTDYSRDGVIDVCKHTREALQDTLDGIPAAFDRDFPDFREAVKAGIQRHDKGKCEEATATPTATETASPTETATAEPTETASPDDGALPPPDDGATPDEGALPPPDESATPESGALPPAESPTPAPTVSPAPTPPVATPTPSATPIVVTRSTTDGLLIPGILVAVALLGALALTMLAISGRSPATRQAFNEAAYRIRGTWSDFSDWLKIGR
jgi:hypothetical protein